MLNFPTWLIKAESAAERHEESLCWNTFRTQKRPNLHGRQRTLFSTFHTRKKWGCDLKKMFLFKKLFPLSLELISGRAKDDDLGRLREREITLIARTKKLAPKCIHTKFSYKRNNLRSYSPFSYVHGRKTSLRKIYFWQNTFELSAHFPENIHFIALPS